MRWPKSFLLIIISLMAFQVHAQDNYDIFLARQFAEQQEYEKAASYYEKLTQSEDGLSELYEEYLEVLRQLNDFTKAEKLIKRVWAYSGKDPLFLIDLRDLYKSVGDEKTAEKTRLRIVNELRPNIYEVKKIATKLIQKGDLVTAKEVYLKGRQLFKDPAAFSLELASLAGMDNDFKGMVDAYLDVIYNQPEEMNAVTQGLQRALKSDENYDLLEAALYKKVASTKTNWPYLELLTWLYMQKNDFESALEQAKALDNQLNEDGIRIIRLARTAAEQKDYTTAVNAYKYITTKGPTNANYVTATLELINTRRDQMVNSTGYTRDQLLALRNDYNDFLKNYYNTYTSTSVAIDLASLEARYLNRADTAITILQDFILRPGVTKELVAKAKLDLGDYFIIKEEPWESTLLYTQVEKDFKGSPLGEEAKYRNARNAYFKGDFDWAQSQLKIIKSNTSEFISNDAIHLSVFITDNLNQDSIQVSLQQYAKAELLLFQNKTEEAIATYQAILKAQPGHPLEDDIYMQLAKIARSRQDYEGAKMWLTKLTTEYYFGILADDAYFILGELEERFFKNPEQAKICYEKILTDYTDSTYTVEARKRFRKLRGEDIR
jgi:hypothetical protein